MSMSSWYHALLCITYYEKSLHERPTVDCCSEYTVGSNNVPSLVFIVFASVLQIRRLINNFQS